MLQYIWYNTLTAYRTVSCVCVYRGALQGRHVMIASAATPCYVTRNYNNTMLQHMVQHINSISYCIVCVYRGALQGRHIMIASAAMPRIIYIYIYIERERCIYIYIYMNYNV